MVRGKGEDSPASSTQFLARPESDSEVMAHNSLPLTPLRPLKFVSCGVGYGKGCGGVRRQRTGAFDFESGSAGWC